MLASQNEGRPAVQIRTEARPGDVESIIDLHRTVYARERGFDPTFADYVAGPLSEFARSGTGRERLWIAEVGGRLVGCVAVVSASPRTAQLRWFLVDPACRGMGLGKALLDMAVAFAGERGYSDLILWTESALTAAARLYRKAGFRRVEERPGRLWGVDLVEEKYELRLR